MKIEFAVHCQSFIWWRFTLSQETITVALQHKDTALQQLMPSKLDMKIKVLGLSQLIVEPTFLFA